MHVLIFILVTTPLFIWSLRQFKRNELWPVLDSLRHGQVVFLVTGSVLGLLMPYITWQIQTVQTTQHAFISYGLIWLGLRVGLECDFRQLKQIPWVSLWGECVSAALIAGFTVLCILAGGSVFFVHLGLVANLSLATLFCVCFILSSRYPEPTLRWKGTPMPPAQDPSHGLPIHNMLAMVLLTVFYPLFASDLSVTVGPFLFAGTIRLVILISALGFLTGCFLDFALRAHRQASTSMASAFCILIFMAGLGTHFGIPPLSLGFLAGAWLINTTVAKRSLLEAIAQVNRVVVPLFFLFVGIAVSNHNSGVFFLWPPLVPLVLMVLIVRSMGRTLGFSVAQYLCGFFTSWRDTLELSARPLGILSVAIAVQSLYLLDINNNTLIVGLIGAVLISQTTLVPPAQHTDKEVALSKD